MLYHSFLSAEVEQKEFRENKYFNQVKLDIDRCQRRFPSGKLLHFSNSKFQLNFSQMNNY